MITARIRIGAMRVLACLGLLLLLPLGPPCRAASTGGSENISVRLVSERSAVRPGDPFQVGLLMKMGEGWHTYWKHPGDAGLPLRIEWTLPPGFSAGPIEWPAPEKVPTGTLMSYGYGREVLLPITITPPAVVEAESVTIAGVFDWLECKDVCLPGTATLSLSLPVRSEAEPGADARKFAEARSRMPSPPQGWSMSAEAGPRALALTVRPPAGVEPRGGYLFVDQPLVVEHAAPQGFERAGGGYRFTVTPAENADGPPSRLTGVLVLEGVSRAKGASAVLVDVPAAPGDPAPAAAPVERSSTWPRVIPYLVVFVVLGVGLAILRSRARRRPAV